MPKEVKDVEYKLLRKFFQNILLYMSRKFVQYIRMLCPGRFILVESVCRIISFQKCVSNYSKICCASSPKKMSHFARANKVAQIVKISPFCRIMAGGIIWWSSFAPKIFFYFHSFQALFCNFYFIKKFIVIQKGLACIFMALKRRLYVSAICKIY